MQSASTTQPQRTPMSHDCDVAGLVPFAAASAHFSSPTALPVCETHDTARVATPVPQLFCVKHGDQGDISQWYVVAGQETRLQARKVAGGTRPAAMHTEAFTADTPLMHIAAPRVVTPSDASVSFMQGDEHGDHDVFTSQYRELHGSPVHVRTNEATPCAAFCVHCERLASGKPAFKQLTLRY